jgi:ribosome-associated protein
MRYLWRLLSVTARKEKKLLLIEDKGQKEGQHILKNRYFENNEIEVLRAPLPVGDYIIADDKVSDVIHRKAKRNMEVKKMDFLGTYAVAVDTKKDMQEIIGNICGKSHPRFRDECILAQNNGIKLYVLIENADGVKSVGDVFKWRNPRLERYNRIKYMQSCGKWLNASIPITPPTSGKTFAKSMLTMQLKYGVEFVFCRPEEAGKKIIELLTK